MYALCIKNICSEVCTCTPVYIFNSGFKSVTDPTT